MNVDCSILWDKVEYVEEKTIGQMFLQTFCSPGPKPFPFVTRDVSDMQYLKFLSIATHFRGGSVFGDHFLKILSPSLGISYASFRPGSELNKSQDRRVDSMSKKHTLGSRPCFLSRFCPNTATKSGTLCASATLLSEMSLSSNLPQLCTLMKVLEYFLMRTVRTWPSVISSRCVCQTSCIIGWVKEVYEALTARVTGLIVGRVSDCLNGL